MANSSQQISGKNSEEFLKNLSYGVDFKLHTPLLYKINTHKWCEKLGYNPDLRVKIIFKC